MQIRLTFDNRTQAGGTVPLAPRSLAVGGVAPVRVLHGRMALYDLEDEEIDLEDFARRAEAETGRAVLSGNTRWPEDDPEGQRQFREFWDAFRVRLRPWAGHVCLLYDIEPVLLLGAMADEDDVYYIVAHDSRSPGRVSASSACGHLFSIEACAPPDRIAVMRDRFLREDLPREPVWIEIDETRGETFPEALIEANRAWRAERDRQRRR